MKKERLDRLLVARGLAESRSQAQRLIMAGQVWVDGLVMDKAGMQVPIDVPLQVASPPHYVSRGGLKLEAALAAFAIEVAGLVAVDVGASTGGFTDCLLQHGASRVYAIDVGYGQLAWSLRQNPRVIVMERTNIRKVVSLPELCDLATVDVSFISLKLVLPVLLRLLKPTGLVIALIKPQFEAGRGQVGKGGVVRDGEQHQQILSSLLAWMQENGYAVRGLMASPVRGPAGNVEFLVSLSRQAQDRQSDESLASMISLAVASTPPESSRRKH